MKRILGILVLTVFSLVSIGENVDRTKATIVATNWYRNYAPKSKTRLSSRRPFPINTKAGSVFTSFLSMKAVSFLSLQMMR
ncbi:MAG: hypothetical protein WCI71_08035 [Bacteroidota bacterium]